MNLPTNGAASRRALYAVLITLAAGSVAGRILAVQRLADPGLGVWRPTAPLATPTLGDNDRSRWDTVRALVDNGTYVIGQRDRSAVAPSAVSLFAAGSVPGSAAPTAVAVAAAGANVRTAQSDHGIVTEDGWISIDRVLRPDTSDFYSSKPPLLPTLVAGEYWLLKNAFGWSITDDRWYVVRTILLTINWLPLICYLVFLSRLLEDLGQTDWGRFYVLGAACFGTLLTPFAITFNNHSVATCCALFALYPTLQIWNGQTHRRGHFVAAGFFAAFTAATELPAASFAAALFLLLLYRAPRATLFGFVPAAVVPVAAFLGTNYLAIGQLRPAYDEFGGPWYEYEGSHWRFDPSVTHTGIDWAFLTENRAVYAFHVLFGHHGLFALTPMYLLAIAGMVYGCWRLVAKFRRDRVFYLPPEKSQPDTIMVTVLSLVLTVVVLGFYIVYVNDRNRNYGGWTTGLRWLMWLTPLWLLSMLPAVDWLASRRWGRGVAYVLLAISVLSASYPTWTPWRHPWLYNFLESEGWIKY
jgi:hypothetical protein